MDMGSPVEISFVIRALEYCCIAGASPELAPARTVALRLTLSRLVRTIGLLPFSPVTTGAMDEPDAEAVEETDVLLALVGHRGAQLPTHPAAAGMASLLGRQPALSLSGDMGSSLLDDGLTPFPAPGRLLTLHPDFVLLTAGVADLVLETLQ